MLSKMSIRRPVTTIMMLCIIITAGVVSLISLKMDLMPSMDVPVALVQTTYAGAGPEEVETLITEPLEEALATIANVKEITSTSSANSSMIVMEFADNTDLDMAALDMRERVDLVKGLLPDNASEPMVLKIDVSELTSALMVGVDSETLDLSELNDFTKDQLENRFKQIEGVASVDLIGGLEREISVEVSPEKLQGYGLTAEQVKQVLAAENINYPTGSMQQGRTAIQMKTAGKFTDISEICALPLTTPAGAVIHLSDVAKVDLVDKDLSGYALIDGKPSVILQIQKQSDANTVEVSDRIDKELTEINAEYEDITVSSLSPIAEHIRSSVGNIVKTAFLAAILAIAVVFFFLQSAKMAFIIGVSIPTSILATFAAMHLAGMTMNTISMAGIAIGIGMLVDNSIVVLENIYNHMKVGDDPKTAAAEGAKEVAMAIMASTLTTVSVFFPMLFVSGVIGDMLRDLALTICFALLISLFVAVTFVPMASSQLLKPAEIRAALENKPKKYGKILQRWQKILQKMDRAYSRVLTGALRHKKRVAVIALAAFILTTALTSVMGFDFMPEGDEGMVVISVTMPKGTVLEETAHAVDQVIDTVAELPEVDSYDTMVGGGLSAFMGGSVDSATIQIELVDLEQRDVSSKELAMQMENMLEDFTAGELSVGAASMMGGGSGGGSDLSMRITGSDYKKLWQIADDVEAMLYHIDGVSSVQNEANEVLPEVQVVVDRDKASRYGLTAAQIGGALNTVVTGSVATQVTLNDTELDVRIRYPDNDFTYISDLDNLTVPTPMGTNIPLSQVAHLEVVEAPVSIYRADNSRYITVGATLYGSDLMTVRQALQSQLADYSMPAGYACSFTGDADSMMESITQLSIALLVAILLVYMIMASQFESFRYPFIVLFSLPLAITGGALGLFLTGKPLSSVAMMGMVMLSGMVVNNAIVLVDAANQNVAKGMTAQEAMLQAGPNRLRPILMTTLTTILGMVPMALALKEGMEMQQPMAITVIFGLLLSTLVTLVLIPVLYVWINHPRKHKIRRLFFRKKKQLPEVNVEN